MGVLLHVQAGYQMVRILASLYHVKKLQQDPIEKISVGYPEDMCITYPQSKTVYSQVIHKFTHTIHRNKALKIKSL